MNDDQLRDKDGHTVEEVLEGICSTLAIDDVGLWDVVSVGWQGFGLKGDGLSDFVRGAIVALAEHGAKPVVAVALPWWVHREGVNPAFPERATHEWRSLDYGDTSEQIADGIMADARIQEWLASGGCPTHDPLGIWFTLPSNISGRKTPQAHEETGG